MVKFKIFCEDIQYNLKNYINFLLFQTPRLLQKDGVWNIYNKIFGKRLENYKFIS